MLTLNASYLQKLTVSALVVSLRTPQSPSCVREIGSNPPKTMWESKLGIQGRLFVPFLEDVKEGMSDAKVSPLQTIHLLVPRSLDFPVSRTVSNNFLLIIHYLV